MSSESLCDKNDGSGCDNELRAPNKTEIKPQVEGKLNVRIRSIINNVILNGFLLLDSSFQLMLFHFEGCFVRS